MACSQVSARVLNKASCRCSSQPASHNQVACPLLASRPPHPAPHAPLPPTQLIKDFSAAMNRPLPPVDGKVPGTNRGCFTDAEWAAAWRRYHRRHAKKLQLVCFRCVKQRNAGQAAGAGSGSDSAA